MGGMNELLGLNFLPVRESIITSPSPRVSVCTEGVLWTEFLQKKDLNFTVRKNLNSSIFVENGSASLEGTKDRPFDSKAVS